MTGDAVHSADGPTSTRVMGKSSALTKWLQRLRALSTRCLLQISPLPPILKRIPLIMKPTTSATSATSLRNTDRRQCLDMVNPHDSTLRKTQCADTLAIRARSLASGRVARTMCGSVCPDDFPGLRLLGRSPTTCGKHAGSFRSLPSAQTALL